MIEILAYSLLLVSFVYCIMILIIVFAAESISVLIISVQIYSYLLNAFHLRNPIIS